MHPMLIGLALLTALSSVLLVGVAVAPRFATPPDPPPPTPLEIACRQLVVLLQPVVAQAAFSFGIMAEGLGRLGDALLAAQQRRAP